MKSNRTAYGRKNYNIIVPVWHINVSLLMISSSELFLVAGLMDQFVTELRNGVMEVADILSGNLLHYHLPLNYCYSFLWQPRVSRKAKC